MRGGAEGSVDEEARLAAWHDAPVSRDPEGGPRPGGAARPGSVRAAVENVSRPLLIRLSRLPRMVPFLVMLALVVAGLFVSGVGGFVLIMLGVAFLAWLLYLGWPQLAMPERLLRLAVIALAVGMAVIQLSPR
jgi:hypothetical protein